MLELMFFPPPTFPNFLALGSSSTCSTASVEEICPSEAMEPGRDELGAEDDEAPWFAMNVKWLMAWSGSFGNLLITPTISSREN